MYTIRRKPLRNHGESRTKMEAIAAERGAPRFTGGANVNECWHGILLFRREFHIHIESDVFRSNRLRERRRLGGGEIKEIFLRHRRWPRGAGYGGERRSRDGDR